MGPLLILVVAGTVLGSQGPLEILQQHTQETINMDADPILSLGRQLLSTVGQKLDSYKLEFDAKFDRLETMCLNGNQVPTQVMISGEEEEKIQKLEAHFEDKLLRFAERVVDAVRGKMMEALNETLDEIEVKMQPVRDDISNVKSQIPKLVTQDEVADLQTKLMALGTDATTHIKEEIDNLPSKDDLRSHKDQLDQQLQEVASAMGNQSTCGDPARVQEVLEKLTESESDLEELSGYMRVVIENGQCESTFDSIINYLETLTETMTGNSQSMSDLEVLVEKMGGEFVTNLENLETVAQKIAEGNKAVDREPSGPTEEEPEEEEKVIQVTSQKIPPTPCLDSSFIGGGRSLDICNAAVRFRKCHLVFVAFHCCRSCMDAGLIDSPPLTYSAPRRVPVLQALKSLRPS